MAGSGPGCSPPTGSTSPPTIRQARPLLSPQSWRPWCRARSRTTRAMAALGSERRSDARAARRRRTRQRASDASAGRPSGRPAGSRTHQHAHHGRPQPPAAASMLVPPADVPPAGVPRTQAQAAPASRRRGSRQRALHAPQLPAAAGMLVPRAGRRIARLHAMGTKRRQTHMRAGSRTRTTVPTGRRTVTCVPRTQAQAGPRGRPRVQVGAWRNVDAPRLDGANRRAPSPERQVTTAWSGLRHVESFVNDMLSRPGEEATRTVWAPKFSNVDHIGKVTSPSLWVILAGQSHVGRHPVGRHESRMLP